MEWDVQEIQRKGRVDFIGWLSGQLESLPPSHPLKHIVFDVVDRRGSLCLVEPEDWVRLDSIVQAKKSIRVTFNLGMHAEHTECCHVLSLGFQRSDRARLLSFGP